MLKSGKMAKSKGKKKTDKKKVGKHKEKVVIKPDMTVMPVTTPDGSVHFDEFLKAYKKLQIPPYQVEPVMKIEDSKTNNLKKGKKSKKDKKSKKGEKNQDNKDQKMSKTKKKNKAEKTEKTTRRGKKGKLSNKKEVVKPDITPPPLNETNSYPKLFPLTMALLLPPTEDDVFTANTLFPEFVVGKTEPPVLRNQASIRLLNVIEQQANKTVNEINRVQEKINYMMQKTVLNDSETVELENHNLMLMVLLEDFENSLAKILRIYHTEQAETRTNQLEDYSEGDEHDGNDEDGWLDTVEEEEMLKSLTTPEFNTIESQHEITDITKWYEVIDLTYLLSNTSFENKQTNLSMSSGLLKIFDELKNKSKSISNTSNDTKRNQVFQRLKKKFNILLPPPKSDEEKKNRQWLDGMDEQLYKDHRDMLDATKDLQIFQCWDQLELKYNIVHALIISLQDAIKSTPPFYYASRDVKSKFVADQSVLVQALDDFKRETNRTFTEVGLADYWKCHPKSIRRCSPPCFDVMIRRRTKEVECAAPPDEQRWWFLQRSPFNTKSSSKHGVKKVHSEDSEIEVDMINYIT